VVVGSGTPPPSLPSTDPRVDLRGYVADAVGVLQGPGVLLVPLRVGGGARTKVLEAMAAGMPLVSTTVGVENLGLVDGRHYLAAETAPEMVAAVVRLSGDPDLAAALGRHGAARIDEAHRWDVIGRTLEPIYRAAIAARERRRPGSSSPRVLLVGVRPGPGELAARGLSFPGHRTEQFAGALREAGCDVASVLLDEEPQTAAPSGNGEVHVLDPDAFGAGDVLQRVHDALAPGAVVAAGGFHAARVVARLATDSPRWIDLPGDLPAEGQARARRDGDGVIADYLSVLAQALRVGDRFSVVGPSQRLALLGQLGLAGRLTGTVLGEDPVEVVPLSASAPEAPPPLPRAGLIALWSGGYNTWMDGETLFEGLEAAMARAAEIVFVSTGGPVAGHDEASHAAFWARARASPFAHRFVDLGRLPRREALRVLSEAHVVLSISRGCLEAELGSRQRLVEGLAHGRPAVATRAGDLAAAIAEKDAGMLVPAGDPRALATALVELAADRNRLAACAEHARALWAERFTVEATTAGLAAWARRPRAWPASVLDEAGLSRLAAKGARLQAELDAIRGSYTFRALRLFDRLVGRAGGRRGQGSP
jgi:glycosyltransferase involved in cell wall biosynthesis